ncbi:MAG TPA: LLM class flavin-dependent oxidoreductase [Thermoanaerobaculia bacterium]|jgi:alkanesulfonate monooxygenase|nr:LLM class flavin-dependent oxidoreductase [Thermoanaerobaculia bacterium]
MPLRFHWSMSSAGEELKGAKARGAVSGIPNLDAHVRFCKTAEECGIESLLTAFGFHRADPIVLAAALGMLTTRIKFMVAVRSGVCSPTLFVQQVNSVAAVTGGRICLNVVAGHTPEEQKYYGDFLAHDERYERTDEFLTVCNAFWKGSGEVNFAGKYYTVEKGKLSTPFVAPDRTSPEIFLGGNSAPGERLAAKHADCMWRLPEPASAMRDRVRPLVDGGIEVGILVSLLVRETHEEAIEATDRLLARFDGAPRRTHEEFARKSDSVAFTSTYKLAKNDDWPAPYLWTGAVPYMGAPSVAIVGSAEEVTNALFAYRDVGVTQFLFMGWPDLEEMARFSRQVLPLVRAREEAEARREEVAAS